MRGLDLPTIGAQCWRRRVVAAPQFHENHVLTGSFAFNLLMGRRWPPQPGDLEEAETVVPQTRPWRTCSTECPQDSCKWSVRPAGNSPTERKAGSILPGLCFSAQISSSLMRASLHLTLRACTSALSYVLAQAPSLLVIAHP